jgi:hypothetical protein
MIPVFFRCRFPKSIWAVSRSFCTVILLQQNLTKSLMNTPVDHHIWGTFEKKVDCFCLIKRNGLIICTQLLDILLWTLVSTSPNFPAFTCFGKAFLKYSYVEMYCRRKKWRDSQFVPPCREGFSNILQLIKSCMGRYKCRLSVYLIRIDGDKDWETSYIIMWP